MRLELCNEFGVTFFDFCNEFGVTGGGTRFFLYNIWRNHLVAFIMKASVWANVLEEGQETSQITTQIGQENGKEGQEKGKKRAKTIRQQIKNCCLIVRG